jgi:hypothetical protein
MREIAWRLLRVDVVTLFVGDLTTYKIRVSKDMSRCYVLLLMLPFLLSESIVCGRSECRRPAKQEQDKKSQKRGNKA